MKYASIQQRIVAYWVDFVFTITFVFLCGRLFWEIVPGSEVRADAMQFYTQKDFNNFVVTAIFSLLVLLIYNIYMPVTRWGGTFGHFISRIKVVETDGSHLKIRTSLKRYSFMILKYVLIISFGPLAAYLKFNFAISIALTLIGIILILVPFTILAWLDAHGTGPIERICGYRIISK